MVQYYTACCCCCCCCWISTAVYAQQHTQGRRARTCKTPTPPTRCRRLSALRCCCRRHGASSQVEPLRSALLFLVHDVLLGLLELGLAHPHAPLAQREEPGLRAHGLDVGAGELLLSHDELLEVDVSGEVHLARVYLEDMTARLLVGGGELDLAVDAPRPDEGGVERLDTHGQDEPLDVGARVEAVELVEQLEHRPLDLALAAALAVVPLRADRVDLVDEDDRGRVLLSHAE